MEKRFTFAGLAALLSLLPVAVTPTKGWIKLSGRNWGRLHRLTYLAGLLAILHFAWQVKAALLEPLIYGVVVFFVTGGSYSER